MTDAQHFAAWWGRWGDTVRFWKIKSVANAAFRDGYAIAIEAATAGETVKHGSTGTAKARAARHRPKGGTMTSNQTVTEAMKPLCEICGKSFLAHGGYPHCCPMYASYRPAREPAEVSDAEVRQQIVKALTGFFPLTNSLSILPAAESIITAIKSKG